MYFQIKPAGSDTGTPFNLKKRINLITHYFGELKNKMVLDCGCAEGTYVSGISKLGANVWGIEYNPNKVYMHKKKGGLNKVFAGDVENLSFKSNSFDIVLLNEVLEHVQNESLALREIHRVLKNSGHIVVFSPNRLFPFETHGIVLKSGKRLSPFVPFVPYVPLQIGKLFFDYKCRNYWPNQLRTKFKRFGFEIQKVDFIFPTFENKSKKQSTVMKYFSPYFRVIGAIIEKIPIIKIFGISQLIIAQKRRLFLNPISKILRP